MGDNDNLTLLFVDDEPSILSALRRLFRPHGYRIMMAESGAAGLEILEREVVDLVISDMRMPEMDGATFLKHVRQRWPEVMRILLTGYADITSTVAAINEGEIYRYISKPWDDNEIVLVVREALERRRLEEENRRLSALTLRQNEELKELNAGLEQKVSERTAEVRAALNELKKTFITTVQVFSGMVELRAGPVGAQLAGHGRRVADHARSLAKRLDLSDAEVQTVMLAGLLHDIGKIGLPDGLLDKPYNNLSADHRALVMKHPVVGQNILMSVEKLRDCALLVRHHHELYDGSGFPDRLSAMAIPLGSRILAVANDYDALQIGTLVQRPLRADEALTFLIDNRGKRYDPQVVDCFAQLLAETGKKAVTELPIRCLQLRPGSVLSRDLNHRDGYLLLSRGSVLTKEIISQLVKLESTEQQPYTLYIKQEEV
ncbi:HD domain-containing phosphohydrolase [Dechloromonas denitrificans]|uniref:HD domain-containing phosphohydrolase n=1 Tax=Dechloromonas denitrificans TaxID=281362 RepID=UPI001CF8BAE3|nr:HD domain-containing phosphohydrolase [Dechloromonas denitrificans]UCV01860.1 response regulator [Dechloromonas denitrificans]UCV06211.1 response regulator [Dechloromonas denitrificans]